MSKPGPTNREQFVARAQFIRAYVELARVQGEQLDLIRKTERAAKVVSFRTRDLAAAHSQAKAVLSADELAAALALAQLDAQRRFSNTPAVPKFVKVAVLVPAETKKSR